MSVDAFFLRVGEDDRFCLFHSPDRTPVTAAVVYVHPFAEEMNKARRVAALGARALADNGFAVLQLDLRGCGDSAAAFGDASWRAWQEDVRAGVEWMRARLDVPLWLWGLRAGALLAAEAAAATAVTRLLFWQPVVAGRQHLTQFLRTKVAAAAIGNGGAGGGVAAMRAHLAAGNCEEVAGYAIAPTLATGLDEAELAPQPSGNVVVWLEVASGEGAALSPVGESWIAKCRATGARVESAVVTGPPFWQTTEIEECPALIEETVRALKAVRA